MSKIIGNTTATPVPRSDWEQTDKTKADFIRHKPDFNGLQNEVSIIGNLVGDIPVSEQISQYIIESGMKIYKQNEEPTNVPDGTLWLDLDEHTGSGGSGDSGGSSGGGAGEPGYTPIKGVDYWTEKDKAEMINDVLAAIPMYGGEIA